MQSPCFLQHFKHVLLKHIQPLIATNIYIRPDNLKVEGWLIRVGWIASRDFCQRVTITAAFIILVVEYRHKQVVDELLDEEGYTGDMCILSTLQVTPRLQKDLVQHQGVLVDEGLGLVVGAGVVEHQHEVLHQTVHILVFICHHVAPQLLHINRLLDGDIVVRQLST